jgi:hypothetical protein
MVRATVDKKKAHTAAKETLRFDETGLAVSMIIATLGDDGGDAGAGVSWNLMASPILMPPRPYC